MLNFVLNFCAQAKVNLTDALNACDPRANADRKNSDKKLNKQVDEPSVKTHNGPTSAVSWKIQI